MSNNKILVTPRSLTAAKPAALELLSDAGFEVLYAEPGKMPSEDELCALLQGCVGYLAGVEKVTERVLDAAPDLRAISRNGVGVDGIDHEAAAARSIQVLTTPGANANGVAELAVGLMFSLARSIPATDQQFKNGSWQRTRGTELHGRRLGLVGFGSIGRRVAEIGSCLGMETVINDPFARAAVVESGHEWAELDALVSDSDVVSLHAPPQEQPVINDRVLSGARSGLLLVNTARAELVDGDALLAALDSGLIGGYATDVYDNEPPTDRRLVEHSRVIATTHIGGYTAESVDRAARAAVENLINALKASEPGDEK